jgi:hypothetical protein
MLTSSYPQTRSFAAVLFRRIASKSRKLPNGDNVELFLSLPREQAYAIRQKLLEALGSESVNSVRNKIGDAVAEIAREYSDNSAFSEVDSHSTELLNIIYQTDHAQRNNGRRFWVSFSLSAYQSRLDSVRTHTGYFLQLPASSRSSMRILCFLLLQKASRILTFR